MIVSLTSKTADHAARVALACVRKRNDIHYSQDLHKRWSGINQAIHLPDVPPYADCSAFVTWVFWTSRIAIRGSAGPDIVNHADWSRGYTGTMSQFGTRHRFGTKFWKRGRTLVFYGRNGISHVALYVGKNKDGVPMVVSHGQEAGPLLVPWNYRSDFVEARAYRI